MLDKRLAIVGPTASGKTAVAANLSTMVKGEIINADSMQIWKGLDIGTAKPDKVEQNTAQFHMLDVAEFDEDYSVAQFKANADQIVSEIEARSRRVILCGGTGLYVKAVTTDMSFPPKAPPEIRKALKQQVAEQGLNDLYLRLTKVDPIAAAKIAPGDEKRIVRALEVYEHTGSPLSSLASDGGPEARGRWLVFGLKVSNAELYIRIQRRLQSMFDNGFVEEVRRLKQKGFHSGLQSARALGYQEVLSHLHGEITLQEAIQKTEISTRQYAKRQRTWFRADRQIIWLDADNNAPKELAQRIVRILDEQAQGQ